MNESTMIDLARATLTTSLMLVTPALIVAMTIGLGISLFQAVTSLQEQTLAIVPKLLAVAATLLVLLPWTLAVLRQFTAGLFSQLASFAPGAP